MKLKVVIKKGEDFGFVAQVPALRGCWSQGATRKEALSNVREAVQAWLEVEQDKIEKKKSANADVELLSI